MDKLIRIHNALKTDMFNMSGVARAAGVHRSVIERMRRGNVGFAAATVDRVYVAMFGKK